MHINDLIAQALEIPFVDLDIPLEELVFEDLPSMDEVLERNQVLNVNEVTLSPPQTAGQTPYTERISIRIPRWLLAELRRKAAERGLPYQTFINEVLAQHAVSVRDSSDKF